LDPQRDTVEEINAARVVEAGVSGMKRLKRKGDGGRECREQYRGMGEGYVMRSWESQCMR